MAVFYTTTHLISVLDILCCRKKNWKKIFCCYNCLDLHHAQSFFLVFISCCPCSLELEQCLEKVTNSRPLALNLHNLFSTLGKKVTPIWKNFSHGKSEKLLQQNTISENRLHWHELNFKRIWKTHFGKILYELVL